MSTGSFERIEKKRPSVFWWVLFHLVAIALAVVSWVTCLFLFNYPERPRNYEWLRTLGRLAPITSFLPLEAPEGTGADPIALYDKYSRLGPPQLEALNLYLRRSYLTNYSSARFNTYVEGSYRVISSRPLRAGDFFYPGLVITLQGYVDLEELDEPTPYPVFIDLMLPLSEESQSAPFEPGTPFPLKKIDHRAAVLNVSKSFFRDEPAYHLTAVPLSYKNYLDAEKKPLPLKVPDPLNLIAPIPPTSLK
jgi:hypothetical protein